jgi:signal peptidase II
VTGLELLIAFAAATAALDQATKQVAAARLHVAGNGRGSIAPISHWQAAALWVLTAACLAVVAAVASGLPAAAAAGFGLAIGGAAGNVADRLVRGSVVDFIVVGRWPAFNVADAAMALGIAIAAVSLL